MADIFISYAHQDGELVKELSPALEAAGYSTWYYEDKGAVGASYLLQIDQEIERCHAVLVVISPESVDSDQVSKEIIRAHESKKKFIPVRRDISHEEFQKRQPEWRMAFGAAVSAEVPPEGAAKVIARILAGLKKLGVEPGGPPALPSSPLRRLSRAATRGISDRDSSLGAGVAAVVGALGLPYTLVNLSRALSPPAGTAGGWVLSTFSGFRTVTILVNLAGAAQNALLLYGSWLIRRRDPRGARLVRADTLSMFATVGLWLLVSLSAFTGADAEAAIPDPSHRSALVSSTILTALIALVPAAIVFALFRNARKAA